MLLNPPRLIFEIVQTAKDAGAHVVNYCNVTRIEIDDQRNTVNAVLAEDVVSGDTYEFRARSVINAAGPYAHCLEGTAKEPAPHTPFSRDMAFVIDRVCDDSAALAVQTRYRDPDAILTRGNRHIFMVPWRDYTLIGVNSRVFEEHPDSLGITETEISGFIDEINEAYPSLELSRQDVRTVNAGLLPFGDNEAGAKNLSFGKRSLVRDHGADGGPRGLVSAISVRWTMGRATAESAVDCIQRILHGRASECLTSTLRVRGFPSTGKEVLREEIRNDEDIGKLPEAHIDNLAMNYGSNWKQLKRVALDDPGLVQPVSGTSTLRGQILIAARDEMVTCLADIVLRRTDIGSGEQPSDDALAECARIAGKELGWSDARMQQEMDSVKNLYPFYRSPVEAPHNRDSK
jgi:glycerol-3-phosphate dehydrogenase